MAQYDGEYRTSAVAPVVFLYQEYRRDYVRFIALSRTTEQTNIPFVIAPKERTHGRFDPH